MLISKNQGLNRIKKCRNQIHLFSILYGQTKQNYLSLFNNITFNPNQFLLLIEHFFSRLMSLRNELKKLKKEAKSKVNRSSKSSVREWNTSFSFCEWEAKVNSVNKIFTHVLHPHKFNLCIFLCIIFLQHIVG